MCAQLSVVTLWSGSSPIHAELAGYLLAESLPVPTRFIWSVNRQDDKTRRLLDAAADRLRAGGHQVWLIESTIRQGDSLLDKHQHVASLYNRVLPSLRTPWVLIVEDDNLPQSGAYGEAAGFLSTHERCGAVCGLYRSRMNPGYACAAPVADRWRRRLKYAKVPRAALRVGFVGAGFTLYRLEVLSSGAPFQPGFVGRTFHGWDANLCLHMRRVGWDVYLHGDIRVGHYCMEVLNWCARKGQPVA